jgi:hypothetical protein
MRWTEIVDNVLTYAYLDDDLVIAFEFWASRSPFPGGTGQGLRRQDPTGVLVRSLLETVDMQRVEGLRSDLAEFLAEVFASVPRKDQRAKGDWYLRGLMLDGRRKSIQAMAARLPDGNEQTRQQ